MTFLRNWRLLILLLFISAGVVVCSSSISMNPHQGNGTSGGTTSNPTCLGSESANKLTQEDRTPALQVTIGGENVGIYDHPRIWLNPTWIDALKAKAVSGNTMWTNLQDANVVADTSQADSSTLLNLALGYVVTGTPNYLSEARTLLLNFTLSSLYDITPPSDCGQSCGNGNIDGGSIDLIYIGAAYDWLAPYLSTADKQTIRDWVYGQFIPFLRCCSYYDDPYHNLGHTKWIGELIWALATVGDDSRANTVLDNQ